jgi:hypothetical protein
MAKTTSVILSMKILSVWSHALPSSLDEYLICCVMTQHTKESMNTHTSVIGYIANNGAPGHAAFSGETEKPSFSFSGHMASILHGHREETQGSGHLGANFVGVASVREGRGMMSKGMPTLAHLV